ncbi:MAG: hypothetical protein WBB32_02250 [Flavobacteriales bacterium]|nr:hypothetical protein [Flavobacteriales bacterium]
MTAAAAGFAFPAFAEPFTAALAAVFFLVATFLVTTLFGFEAAFLALVLATTFFAAFAGLFALATVFFTAAFFTGFFGAAFLVAVFLLDAAFAFAEAFGLAADFFTAAFFTAFLGVAFLVAVLRATLFLATALLAAAFPALAGLFVLVDFFMVLVFGRLRQGSASTIPFHDPRSFVLHMRS